MRYDTNLGCTESGKHLFLDEGARSTHMHVLGASGRGKSYFLEHLIRQDITHGHGVCLIDPHGTLYDHIVSWCAEHAIVPWDNLILLDAAEPNWTFGFNPLDFGAADISYSVDSMVRACAQVWGGEDTSSTPLLTRVLRGVFHALAEKRLTLLEAHYLINEREEFREVRQLLTRDIADPIIREQWEKWNALRPADFRAEFGSATNRLAEFLSAQVVRLIIGQTDPVLDLRKVMDEGAVVLVSLRSGGRLSDMNARTLGTLLVNDLFLKAQGRPEGSRPFYLYIDECGRYLTESIQRILDESRKRGLHLILANQHLSQLRAAGETVYSAVMTDAQTKVIFGGLTTADADTMVREVFLDLNLEEPKTSLTHKVVVGQEKVILHGGSTSRTHSETTGHASGRGTSSSSLSSRGLSEGESVPIYDDGQEGVVRVSWGQSTGEAHGESMSESEVDSTATSESVSEMSSWAEAFKPIYENAIGGLFTLEEQRYRKVSWLKKQPRQLALLARPDFSLVPFRVADVKPPFVGPELMGEFVRARFHEIPFVQEARVILDSIEERRMELLAPLGPEVAQEVFDPWDNG